LTYFFTKKNSCKQKEQEDIKKISNFVEAKQINFSDFVTTAMRKTKIVEKYQKVLKCKKRFKPYQWMQKKFSSCAAQYWPKCDKLADLDPLVSQCLKK
jgi:hypothetical protein